MEEQNIGKIIAWKFWKYVYLIISNIFWFFSWFISILGITVIVSVSVIIIVIYWLLTYFFQPLVPYNKQDVLFESFMISKSQNYYKEYVNNYKNVCKRDFYSNLTSTWLVQYTGKNNLCKDPINLTPTYVWADWWLSTREKLVRWATIEKIAKQLSKVMIFKNWLSWKYKLTRINTNKIKVVWVDKNNKLDIINIYNPFLLSNSWIFIDDSNWNWWIEYKDKIINKQRYRLDFQDNSEQSLFKKLYNINSSKNWWIELENYKVDGAKFNYNIYIPPSIKNNPKLRTQFINNFKKQYNPVIYSVYNNLLNAYNNIKEKWWTKKITMCYDNPIKIPYFIKNKLQKDYYSYGWEQWNYDDIEKYNQYWLVCITINNIYSKLDKKNSWKTNSFIVKLWQAVDADISINVYNLNYIYKNIVSKYSNKIQNKFLKRYANKLKSNYKTIYMLKWYMRNQKVQNDYLDYSYNKSSHTVKYTLANMWSIWDRHKQTILETRTFNYWYIKTTLDLRKNSIENQNKTERGYWNDFTIENLYFNYLNNLLFNIWDKSIMEDLDKQPQYLFNFWNLYDKNSFNFYYWYLTNKEITKENNASWWNVFDFSSTDKDKLSILNFYNYWEKNLWNTNTYYNQVIKFYNFPDLKWKNALSLSMFNADEEIEQIWVSPLFMFFQIPQWNDKKKQQFSKYYKTKFENFNFLFDINKFKNLYKDISGLLKTNYIKSRFDTDKTINFELESNKWLARLYKNYDTNSKIQIIADYINWKRQINKSLKQYIDKQLTGWVVWQNLAVYITTQIIMENKYMKDYWCNYDLKKTVDFLKDKKVNKTFYKVNWWESNANNILCYFWNKNACKQKQIVKLAKCENWLFKLYSFIQHLLKIKLYLQDLINFKETHKIKNFTLLDTVLNKDYLFNHTYLTNNSFASEYLQNDFFMIIWINIFDKDKINEFKDKITLSKYNFGKVTDNFINEIKNINCKKLLQDNNINVNQWNINTCERWKIALVKYFKSWISLSQAKQYLEKLNKDWNQEQIFQVLINYWMAWQCTRFVQWKYPEINFWWNAKEWCDNASKKWRPVIYDAWSVWTGAVIVWNFGTYWHVGIVEKIDKKNKRLLIDDMNWKWPFIESHHRMNMYHPNFECYIKIR